MYKYVIIYLCGPGRQCRRPANRVPPNPNGWSEETTHFQKSPINHRLLLLFPSYRNHVIHSFFFHPNFPSYSNRNTSYYLIIPLFQSCCCDKISLSTPQRSPDSASKESCNKHCRSPSCKSDDTSGDRSSTCCTRFYLVLPHQHGNFPTSQLLWDEKFGENILWNIPWDSGIDTTNSHVISHTVQYRFPIVNLRPFRSSQAISTENPNRRRLQTVNQQTRIGLEEFLARSRG